MPTTFQIGAGNKVKLYVALLPLGNRTEPTDVATITASGGITSGATSITVTALPGTIPGGTPLTFSNGTATLKVYTSADAITGATAIPVELTTAALTGSSTSTYTAQLRLLGGTSLDANINADNTEVLVFEDPLGFKDGAITSQSWQLPWTANLLSNDDAYRRVYYAAINAVTGREVYVWQQDAPPNGYTMGDGLKGACAVMNFSKKLVSQGILTVSLEFMGRGTPTITRYS